MSSPNFVKVFICETDAKLFSDAEMKTAIIHIVPHTVTKPLQREKKNISEELFGIRISSLLNQTSRQTRNFSQFSCP